MKAAMTKNEFWSNVEIRSLRECWPWIGKGLTGDGYANAYLKIDGHGHHVHVCAWILVKGEIPTGFHIHHKCENKLCCNVLHLEKITAVEHAKLHHTKKSAICAKCGGDKRHIPKYGRWLCDPCHREQMLKRNQTPAQQEAKRIRERNRYWQNKINQKRKIGDSNSD